MEMIDLVKIEIEKINKEFIEDFDDVIIDINFEIAQGLSCCPCDVKINALLTMCLLLDNLQSMDKITGLKYKHLIYSKGRLAKSKAVGSVNVSYADGESEYDRNYYGKLYSQMCKAKKKRFMGIGVIR